MIEAKASESAELRTSSGRTPAGADATGADATTVRASELLLLLMGMRVLVVVIAVREGSEGTAEGKGGPWSGAD